MNDDERDADMATLAEILWDCVWDGSDWLKHRAKNLGHLDKLNAIKSRAEKRSAQKAA